MSARQRIINIFILILLSLGTVIMLGPFVWMILSSFKSTHEILKIPLPFLPEQPTLHAYKTILTEVEKVNIFAMYKNSLIITVSVTILGLLGSSLVGFVFAKYRFPGRDILFVSIIATMMIPFEVRFIPLYKLAVDLRLNNTYFGLMIPSLTSTFGIFLMRQHIIQIPDDLIDAATVDGCSNLGIYWNVVLPSIKPALGTLAIFTFMWNWDMFLWPLVMVDRKELYTIPLGLASFVIQGYRMNYNYFMAASCLAVIPVIAVFLAAQKQVIRGVALTGLKG